MPDLWIRRRRWRVEGIRAGDSLRCVTATARDNGEVRRFLLPAEPSSPARAPRVRHVRVHQGLARLASHIGNTAIAFTPRVAATSPMVLHAFQLEPALAIAAGRRRVLIADGVGLGKTIEAGLIAASVQHDYPDARILIVAPASLHAQWANELQRWFSLTVTRADAQTLAQLRVDLPYASSPWQRPGLWLTSTDFLKQPHVVAGLPDTSWDLLIVDEAHQLSGLSQRHDAIDALAHRCTRLVLLTATPHDGDDARHQRLLSLGQRGSHDTLTTFRRLDRPAGPGRRTRWLPAALSPRDRIVLAAIDRFERTSRGALLCSVFRRRVLSSHPALAATVARRKAIIQSATTEQWQQGTLFELDVIDRDELAALHSDTGVAPSTEIAWLERLATLCGAARDGGRLRVFSSLLRRVSEPVVVFTQYRDTLEAVLPLIPKARQTTLLHGGLSARDMAEGIHAFVSGRTNTLIATDVASQGLNLQSRARWVLCLDVPFTPLRLEQRIGRVDRIGQHRRVHATVLTSSHVADLDARRRFDARVQRAERADAASCRRWTAAAVGLANWFTRQRRLSRLWRAVSRPAPISISICPTTAQRWFGLAADGLEVVSVTFSRRSGGTIEDRLFVVPMSAPADTLSSLISAHAQRLRARLRTRHLRAELPAQSPTLAPASQMPLFGGRPTNTATSPPAVAPSAEDDVLASEPVIVLHVIIRGGDR